MTYGVAWRKKELVDAVDFNGVELEALYIKYYCAVVSPLLKRYANDETIARADSATLCFTHLAGMILSKHDKDLFARATSVGNVYDGRTSNNRFIDGVDESIRYSSRHH